MDGNTHASNEFFFTENMVAAKVLTSGWEDAVEKVGQIMVDAGAVESRYVEAMKRTISELGPYSVIAPGIAMPHARPEDGVLRPCFALITLANPVEFGSSENDPVYIVIAFGATDKTQHIDALARIGQIFGDAQKVQKILRADSKANLLESLN